MPINYGDNVINVGGSMNIASGNFTNGLQIDNNLTINARYTEKIVPVSIVSSGVTLNLSSGNLFTTTLNSNISGIIISNPPSASNTAIGFSWILTADGTSRTITWPNSIKWPGGTTPTLTSTNAKRDILSFLSTDNGTSYLGFIGGQNY